MNEWKMPIRGKLKDRYDAYVKAMIDLGKPYVDFDTWLNGGAKCL